MSMISQIARDGNGQPRISDLFYTHAPLSAVGFFPDGQATQVAAQPPGETSPLGQVSHLLLSTYVPFGQLVHLPCESLNHPNGHFAVQYVAPDMRLSVPTGQEKQLHGVAKRLYSPGAHLTQ
eukprot:gb/GEZJ01006061.1/.p2 GENE.gb/GEZJ01006061.1/~~gb/GEZJ01006061.1/.p2  ORF type:complete len:122 (+),score=7.27 gb/GEZJ01006061.1/:162-527(+)